MSVPDPLIVTPEMPDPLPPSPSVTVDLPASVTAKKATKSTFASVFTSTFFTILFAEMGDKTQLTTLLMTAESQKPLVVFLGAGSALVTTSLLGVLLGRWLANRVSEEAIETAAGIALMVISVLLIGDMFDMT